MCGCASNCNCENSTVLPIGPKGDTGATGATGATGTAGTNGTNGTNGTTVLYAYNNATGVGVPASLVETVLGSYTFLANELATNGDEVEVFSYLTYVSASTALLNFKLGGLTIYTYNQAGAAAAKILIKIRIARISVASQLWTIEINKSDVITPSYITVVDSVSSVADSTVANLFQITGQNVTSSTADRVNLKKLTILKHRA